MCSRRLVSKRAFGSLSSHCGRLAEAAKDVEEGGIGLLLEAGCRIYNGTVNQTFATIDSDALGTEEAAAWCEPYELRSKLIMSTDEAGVIGRARLFPKNQRRFDIVETLEMPLQQINGQWINYEDTGGQFGPVVLAHGLLMDHEMFAPQIEAGVSGCRFITWDARCHGETESTDEPFTYWDLADDLKSLLDHLGDGRAVIGGMGQGGFVALRFALKYPERVSAVILLGTQAGIEDRYKAGAYESMLDVWEADGLNDQLAEAVASIILGNEWPGRERWIAKWRQMPRSLLRQAFQTLISREDIHDRLGEIKAPALVIHGTADAAIDIEAAQRLGSELANCQQVIAIEGGGHACNLTHPKEVNLAVQEFLGGLVHRTPRGAERRGDGRRSHVERRSGERRDPVRAGTGRRRRFPFDRRMAERRTLERRAWPGVSGST